MSFTGFTNDDFNLFQIEGLNERMDALIKRVRPKLEFLGDHFAPTLSVLTGQEMFAHVAKHARRTINPPKDTWVAFANNNRGYKMLPHFQIGLWETHLFIWFAVIYECPTKIEIGKKFESHIDQIFNTTPFDFSWSLDHTKPEAMLHETLTKADLSSFFTRLISVKKAELLCGYRIPRELACNMSSDELVSKMDSIFRTLNPLYKMISH